MGLARRLRGRSTGAEETLWVCLRNRRMFGAKFRRQHPLGRYIADFYCHEARLAIELEGHIHNAKDQKEYDRVREQIIRQQGIELLRFTNEELTNQLDGVLSIISKALNSPLPPTLPPERPPLSLRERGQGVRENEEANQ